MVLSVKTLRQKVPVARSQVKPGVGMGERGQCSWFTYSFSLFAGNQFRTALYRVKSVLQLSSCLSLIEYDIKQNLPAGFNQVVNNSIPVVKEFPNEESFV